MKAIRQFFVLLFIATIMVVGSATPSGAIKVFIVFFDSDSAELSYEAKAVIAEVANYIFAIEIPCTSVELFGHTDGAEHDADQLSLRRAKAVREELRRLRIPLSVVINVHSVGATQMVVDAEGPEPQNRRVHLDYCPKELNEIFRRRHPLPSGR